MATNSMKTRTCEGKKSFPDRADAVRVRNSMIDSGRSAPGSLGVYPGEGERPCKHCGGFHVGHRRIDASTRGGQRGGGQRGGGRSGGRRQGGRR